MIKGFFLNRDRFIRTIRNNNNNIKNKRNHPLTLHFIFIFKRYVSNTKNCGVKKRI